MVLLIFCNKCGQENPNESSFCNKCGAGLIVKALQENEDKSDYKETIEHQNSNYKKNQNSTPKFRMIIPFLCILVIFLIGYFVYNSYFTTEAKAKNTVIDYLNAIKKSESTYDYKKANVDDFINVLSYKHVKTYPIKKLDKTYRYDLNSYENDSYYKNKMTFAEYIEEEKKAKNIIVYEGSKSTITIDTSEVFEYTTGDKYNNVELVFDVEVTNGLGNKLYKKVHFYVDNSISSSYKINEIIY